MLCVVIALDESFLIAKSIKVAATPVDYLQHPFSPLRDETVHLTM